MPDHGTSVPAAPERTLALRININAKVASLEGALGLGQTAFLSSYLEDLRAVRAT
jgi:hypothetical protein